MTIEDHIWSIILLVVFFGVIFAGVNYAVFSENRAWNGGTCRRCGTKWRSFDQDSQGGRGYNCESRDHTIWISYPWIDRDYDGSEEKSA